MKVHSPSKTLTLVADEEDFGDKIEIPSLSFVPI